MKVIIEKIAKKHLRLETLETRNSDSLDFKEQAVWDIKNALEEAYKAGEEAKDSCSQPMVVDNNDMWILLGSTIRYSMGRRTYMSSLAPELVLKYKEYLTSEQMLQISKEIERETKSYEKSNRTLGSDFDHISWKEFAVKIRKAKRRKRVKS
jgi:hypothetical protein